MISRRILTSQKADEDINTAIGHYLHQGAAEAAMNLIDELEETKVLLSEHPYLGSTRFAMETNIPELRSLSLARFPYIVFYTAQGDTIRIHRVLHTARDLPSRFSEDEG